MQQSSTTTPEAIYLLTLNNVENFWSTFLVILCNRSYVIDEEASLLLPRQVPPECCPMHAYMHVPHMRLHMRPPLVPHYSSQLVHTQTPTGVTACAASPSRRTPGPSRREHLMRFPARNHHHHAHQVHRMSGHLPDQQCWLTCAMQNKWCANQRSARLAGKAAVQSTT